jgi:hypothetical protein
VYSTHAPVGTASGQLRTGLFLETMPISVIAAPYNSVRNQGNALLWRPTRKARSRAMTQNGSVSDTARRMEEVGKKQAHGFARN